MVERRKKKMIVQQEFDALDNTLEFTKAEVQLTTRSRGNGRRLTLSRLQRGVFWSILSLQRTLQSESRTKGS
jgi:hypothetical protein